MVEGRLLLVDDEPALLDLLKTYLERLGYQVDACTESQDALTRFAAAPGRYSLVMTDLTLDGMSGEQMLEQMRALNPELPAIVSSGYPYQPSAAKTLFLQKPYIPRMLADAIVKMLQIART